MDIFYEQVKFSQLLKSEKSKKKLSKKVDKIFKKLDDKYNK